jgi:hypothetical protein
MLQARITYERRDGVSRTLDLTLGNHYGSEAGLAHEVLLHALTAAKKPVVFDATGRFYRIPRQRLHSLMVWQSSLGPDATHAI